MSAPICLIDGQNGVYIPQLFVSKYASSFDGIGKEDARVVSCGPDHPHYWDAWDCIVAGAYTIIDNVIYRLYHETDLFLVDEEFEIEL